MLSGVRDLAVLDSKFSEGGEVGFADLDDHSSLGLQFQ